MPYCEDYPQRSCVGRPLRQVSQPFLDMRSGNLTRGGKKKEKEGTSNPGCKAARFPQGPDYMCAGDGIRSIGAKARGLSNLVPVLRQRPGRMFAARVQN